MPDQNFNAIAQIEESATGSQAGANIGVSFTDNAVESNSSSWLDCCGLFSSSSEKAQSIDGHGVEQSERQELSLFGCCFGCCAYEQTKTSDVGAGGVEEGAAESLTCCGLTCGYDAGCKNGVPSCDLVCAEKCEIPPILNTCGEGIAQGANAACDLVGGILSILG